MFDVYCKKNVNLTAPHGKIGICSARIFLTSFLLLQAFCPNCCDYAKLFSFLTLYLIRTVRLQNR